jgi:predicted secreted protein
MPNFRFETVAGGRSSIIEENLPSVDLASPKAVGLAKAAVSANCPDADHSGSHVKVYDDAGYLIATVNFSDVLGDGSADQSNRPNEEPSVIRSG